MLFHISKDTIIPEVMHKAAAEIAGHAIAAAEESTQPEELNEVSTQNAEEIQTKGTAPELDDDMDEAAKQARRQYYKEYRQRNGDRMRERERAWRNANREKVRETNRRYWQRKAAEAAKSVKG